jgi:hypothetical protein
VAGVLRTPVARSVLLHLTPGSVYREDFRSLNFLLVQGRGRRSVDRGIYPGSWHTELREERREPKDLSKRPHHFFAGLHERAILPEVTPGDVKD